MKEEYKKIAYWSLFGLTAIVSLYLISVLGFWFGNQLVAYPGSTVGNESVSGDTKAEIEKKVEALASPYQTKSITFRAEKPVTVKIDSLGLKADLAQTAKDITAWGAENPFMLGTRHDFPIIFTADQAALSKVLDGISSDYSTEAIDPTFRLENGEIKVVAGSVGRRVNLAETAKNFYEAIGRLETDVYVATSTIEPSFTEEEAMAQMTEIKRVTQNPIVVSDGPATYNIDQKTLVSWIAPSGSQPTYARIFGDDPLFLPLNGGIQSNSLFSSQKVADHLTGLTPKINKAAVNSKLSAQNGTVIISSPSVNGAALDVPASTVAILDALGAGETEAKLVVAVKRPEVREDNLAELGLSELVSTGYTNFAGSPANRIHNVKTGTSKFNGVLIKPNEEFSFNTTLGPVDASTGYLPELVILEDKTAMEYGGGMCQVSSTAFRAALNGGLPIVERLYHAYPVSYYKPYGVDATIYLPKPDLVFKNDTGKYILIQTRIEGYKLSFDFYGTKVARTVKFQGNEAGIGAVPIVEQITPLIYDQGVRGKGSFTAQFWRFIYDSSGKLVTKSNWVSKYDSPDKYPH